MRWRSALPRRQPVNSWPDMATATWSRSLLLSAYRMTGTSKAVRWLAISSEGRASATRGAMRGASTSQTNGRTTTSRKPMRTQRTAGHQGQRGKTASAVLASGWGQQAMASTLPLVPWSLHRAHAYPRLDGGCKQTAQIADRSHLFPDGIIELQAKAGFERRLQLHHAPGCPGADPRPNGRSPSPPGSPRPIGATPRAAGRRGPRQHRSRRQRLLRPALHLPAQHLAGRGAGKLRLRPAQPVANLLEGRQLAIGAIHRALQIVACPCGG